MIVRETGIIIALDLNSKNSAFDLLKSTSKYIDAIKIGYPLVLKAGIGIVRELKETYTQPVIADFKVSDIPYISKRIARITFHHGCDGIMVHGFAGPDVVKACVKEAKRNMVFVVTELTSPGGTIFTESVAEDIARMAKVLGAYGIQAPGTRPERIAKLRKIVGENLIIISCGIGAQGPDPGSAISAGADFEIIGRAIYEAPSPSESIKKISQLTKKAIEKKM